MNKTNKYTEFQFYWYDDSTCFGQLFCTSSGVPNRTSSLVHYMQLWWPYGSVRSPQLHIMCQSRCTAQNSWWWAERLPETCRVVIPVKLEFSVSVAFIHFNKKWTIRKGWCLWKNLKGNAYGRKWQNFNVLQNCLLAENEIGVKWNAGSPGFESVMLIIHLPWPEQTFVTSINKDELAPLCPKNT
jgi:hypothetical protein